MADITSNLIGLYKLDEGSGTSAFDSSGNGNNGSLIGSPSYTTGKIGPYCISLDGSTQYVDIPISPITYPTITVSCWFKANSFASGNPRLIANGHSDFDWKGFQLAINNGGTTGFFDIGAGSSFSVEAAWSQVLSTGVWYNYVGVWGDGGNIAKAYINGSNVATSGAFGFSNLTASGVNVSAGRNPAYNGDYFNGLIDDVRIYNRALTSADVTALYQYTGASGGFFLFT